MHNIARINRPDEQARTTHTACRAKSILMYPRSTPTPHNTIYTSAFHLIKSIQLLITPPLIRINQWFCRAFFLAQVILAPDARPYLFREDLAGARLPRVGVGMGAGVGRIGVGFGMGGRGVAGAVVPVGAGWAQTGGCGAGRSWR